MGNLRRPPKLVEKRYGQDALILALARGHLGKPIGSEAVFHVEGILSEIHHADGHSHRIEQGGSIRFPVHLP
ncbi:MAG: hypothetical protein LBD06_09450 [Candidatus Accumulibacter sp.]|nr:hypothetical protein [Accumulibacter sp.]